ncbi:MAG: long-chain-fatty-acid--CoA ligase [Wolinella sp.]
MESNLYSFLHKNAQDFSNKVALFIEKQTLTYQKLLQESDRVASFLVDKGVKKGDRVAIILANSWEFIATLFGVFRIGAIAVPINTMLKSDELEYILKDSGAVVAFISTRFQKETKWLTNVAQPRFLIWHESGEEMGELIENERNIKYTSIPAVGNLDKTWAQGGEEIAMIIYTSGTTGFPKGAMLSHNNLLSNLRVVTERFQIHLKDRFIVYLPMFHAFTLTASILLPLYRACSLVIIRSIMPFSNILKQVLFKRVTIFFGVPDVYNALIRAKLPWYFMWFNSVRIFVSGASALSGATRMQYKKRFKRAVMIEGYGLSECSPIVAANLLEQQKPSSVGIPFSGYEVKIVDEELVELPLGERGEIIVRGGCVMKGYLNHPESTKNTIVNGWLLTGDIGCMDHEGHLYILDRKKDIIISKGINIYPREIEETLMAGFPMIKACAVVGFLEESLEEIPIAFIEYEPDSPHYSGAELRGYLKQHLANFKIPKHIYVREELPKNATGKILKRLLKQELQERGIQGSKSLFKHH